jgi:acetyl esterase
VYLRKITKNLNIPIFAIDYRLAPKTQFPYNFEDTLTGIFWILQFIKDVFGTEVEQYILMGDSAGGSLCVSICQWLIESGIDQLPQMLSLSYPALSCR